MTTPLVFNSEAGLQIVIIWTHSLTDPPFLYVKQALQSAILGTHTFNNPPIFGCEASSVICYHMDSLTH